jgi:hypothetical protein
MCKQYSSKIYQEFQKDYSFMYGARLDHQRSFSGLQSKIKAVERPYLTKEEIQMIYEKEFASDRLNQVRDIFFQLLYRIGLCGCQAIIKSNINIGIDGDQWIFTHRQKPILNKSSIIAFGSGAGFKI